MSRLAKKTIPIPQGVFLQREGGYVVVQGVRGEKRLAILPYVEVNMGTAAVGVSAAKEMTQARANCGTMWALLKNAISGVTEGFSKVLELEGVGYRAALEGGTLVLSLGFVNAVRFVPPKDIVLSVEKNTITVSGVDKELVGQIAAQIRAFRPPEPYKGKGIRYQGEVIRRKAGKKAVSAAA